MTTNTEPTNEIEQFFSVTTSLKLKKITSPSTLLGSLMLRPATSACPYLSREFVIGSFQIRSIRLVG